MNSNRLPQLDFLRTLAILLVFLIHVKLDNGEWWFGVVAASGWIGVDLFFVLSGYLIASQLLKIQTKENKIPLVPFYIKRAFRIWPSFFVVLWGYLVYPNFDPTGRLPEVWRFFTFTQNFGLDYEVSGTFTHAWSICVEEHFYLLLPLIFIFTYKRLSLRGAALVIGSFFIFEAVLRGILWNQHLAALYLSGDKKLLAKLFTKIIYYPTYCRLDGLLAGVSVALISIRAPDLWEKFCRKSDLFLVSGLIAVLFSQWVCHFQYSLASTVFGFTILAIGFGCILVSALSERGIFSKFRSSWFKWPAILSYAFYLTHIQTIEIMRNLLKDWGVVDESFLFPLFLFIFSVGVSLGLYFLVERTFTKIREQFFSF